MTTAEILQIAAKKAAQSSARYRVSCMAFNKKGEYIGSAVNKPYYPNRGIHAEEHLVQKYGRKIHSIILCRTNKHGKFLKIHPCKSCQKLLDKMGIKVFTIEGS